MHIRNLRNDECYSKMASLLLEVGEGSEVVFSPARGNWGDGLINFGTRQFLDHFNIRYSEVHKQATNERLREGYFSDKLVVIGGGGAWSRNFALSRQQAELIAGQAKHVVVLPTTFDLPALESSNVTYFARDTYNSLTNVPGAEFCHDMAFFTELQVSSPDNRAWKLFAMRSDREGQGHAGHFPLNFDISMLGDGNYKFVDPFFNIVNNFSVVSTDRMHVAIAAAMLGRRTNLLPGNYAKSRDVYLSSIEGRFPTVTLCSIEELLAWHQGK